MKLVFQDSCSLRRNDLKGLSEPGWFFRMAPLHVADLKVKPN